MITILGPIKESEINSAGVHTTWTNENAKQLKKIMKEFNLHPHIIEAYVPNDLLHEASQVTQSKFIKLGIEEKSVSSPVYNVLLTQVAISLHPELKAELKSICG